MRYKMRCRFAAIEIMGGYLRDSVKQQIGICRTKRKSIVGDGFPVPLHSSLFTASPNPFGRFSRLLREAKRLPY